MKKIKLTLFIIILICGIYTIPALSTQFKDNKNSVVQNNANVQQSINDDYNNTENIIYLDQSNTSIEPIEVNNQIDNFTYEYKTVEKYDNNIVYKIEYPVLNREDIQNLINENIEYYINNFEAEYDNYNSTDKVYFNLDLEMNTLNDRVLFVKFIIDRNYQSYPDLVRFYYTFIIDIDSGKYVHIDEVLNEGYEDLFYLYAKEYFYFNYGITITKKSENYDHIKPDKELYKDLYYNGNYFEIYFYDYKKQEIVFTNIDYGKILPYINNNYLETTTIIIEETSTQATSTEETSTQTTTQAVEETKTQEVEDKDTETVNTRNIDPNKPMIALTFDDGPNNKVTDSILSVLEENNSVATFFVVSRRLDKDSEVIKRMNSIGCQIGNHTANHLDLTKVSSEKISTEMNTVNQKIKEIIDQEPSIVRVPYGAVNDNVKNSVSYPMIMWNVDTKDWQSRDAKKIESQVIGKVKDGDIILMHDLYESTAQACEKIIPQLIEQGFQLVTIDELFEYKNIELKDGVVYYNAK